MTSKKITCRNNLFFLLTYVLCSFGVLAQEQNQYDKGTPPQHSAGVSPLGSYTTDELGSINLSNGALNFSLPLATIGGRGFSVPLTLNYSSKIWSASTDTDKKGNNPQFRAAFAEFTHLYSSSGFYGQIGAGWSIGAAPALSQQIVRIKKIASGPNVGCYTYTLPKLTLRLPGNGEIDFRDEFYDGAPLLSDCSGWVASGSRGSRWHSTDGSGMIYISDTDNAAALQGPNLSGVVITSDGTRYRFNAGGQCLSITDRNGNQILISYISANEIQYIDQLGRVTRIQKSVADPENPGVTLALLVTVPGYNAANRYYKIKSGIMSQYYRSDDTPTTPVITGDYDPLNMYPNQSGTKLFPLSYAKFFQRIDNRNVLSELELPDHRSLRFKYNRFGELAEAELPTGGKIWYDYQTSFSLPAGNSPEHETTGEHHTIVNIDRALSKRKTFADGFTLDCTWNYSYSDTSTNVTATAATGTLVINESHHFLPEGRYMGAPGGAAGAYDGTYYNLWSTGIEWRTETKDAAGSVIIATEQEWTQREPVSWSTYPSEQIEKDNRINIQRKILDDGKVGYVSTIYDQFNNPIETSEFDFGNVLKRRTVTSYSATIPVNGVNYAADSIHLLRLPLQQSIFDGATPAVEQARTVYEYDVYSNDPNAPLQIYSTVTGHDTVNYGAAKTTRGNTTRIGRWIKTNNTYLYTYSRYDMVGNVVSLKDARGNLSTISYIDDFGIGSSPGSGIQGTNGATYALPTLFTSPPPNSGEPAHTGRSQYDFATGLLTGFKDRNNVISQTIYDDPFHRPTLIKSALGVSGVESHAVMYYAPSVLPEFGITLTRNDVLTVSDQASLDDKLLRSWTVTDGFGRTLESWSGDPQGDVLVATNYDKLGRPFQASNPFRPSPGVSPEYTTTGYDLAGRVTSLTTPDNAVVLTEHASNAVTVTDQAGKARKSVTDALGRLKEVYEDPSGLNYLTSYSYDALDNLTNVTQGVQSRSFVYDSLKRLTSAANPESGTISFQYDANGNLTQKTDARIPAVTTTFVYDALNRLTNRSYSDGTPAVAYSYDTVTNSKGRLTSVTSTVSSYSYSQFDAMGRVKAGTQTTNGQSYLMSYSYNLIGSMTSQTYPSGREVTSEYDSAGRLAGVKNQASGLYYAGAAGNDSTNRIQYTAHGVASHMRLGNGLWEHTNFNVRLQPTQIGLGTSSTDSSVLQLDYGYGTTANNGNVLSQTTTIPGLTLSQVYGYDALNRLETASENLGASWTQNFSYDRFGNRNFGAGTTFPAQLNASNNPVINPNNNRIDTAAIGQTTYSYDGAGNLTHDAAGHSFGYDAENKLTTYDGGATNGGATYSYDGDGRRVKKSVGGAPIVTTVFVYNVVGQLVAEYSDASPPTSGGTTYLTGDTLGTPRVITGSNQELKTRHDYLPFGEELFAGSGGRTSGHGYSSDKIRQKFTSKERDNETGQDYFINRYYSPQHGRFTSVDPYNIVREVQITAKQDGAKASDQLNSYINAPQEWNRYSYTLGNPLKYVDPTGERIELTGDIQAAFARIKALVGAKAAKLLYLRTENGHTYVDYHGSRGDDWKNIDDLLKAEPGGINVFLVNAINRKDKTIEFQVADSFTDKFGKTLSTAGGACGGACTVGAEESKTGNTQIFLNKYAGAISEAVFNSPRFHFKFSRPEGTRVWSEDDVVLAHEFGHAYANAFEGARLRGSESTYGRSVMFENMQRATYPDRTRVRRTVE